MKRPKKLLSWVISLAFIVSAVTLAVHANSAEPPGLTVIVNFPPDDLTLAVRFDGGGITPLQKEKRGWEAYYRFFYQEIQHETFESATLIVSSSGKSFEIELPGQMFGYNSLIALDLENESVSEWQTAARSVLLIAMRVVSTLIIEGIVFFAFGYRKKLSWAAFVIANLLTQALLNIILSGGPNISLSYWLFTFIVLEIIILILESYAYVLALTEYTKKRAMLCALTANYASFVLGWVFLSYLPV